MIKENKLTVLITFFFGLIIGLCFGIVLSISLNPPMPYSSTKIESNFSKVKSGMTSGEALKTIFENVFVFPELSQEHPNSSIEKWCIWGYDLKKMLEARSKGSSPFTLTVDTKTDKVIKADYEYNTRFD